MEGDQLPADLQALVERWEAEDRDHDPPDESLAEHASQAFAKFLEEDWRRKGLL